MPITKQKHIRYYALDRCFRNKSRRYYIEDLLSECNKALQQCDCAPISERTLKNDLNEFEDIYKTNIDHIHDGYGRTYYRYSNPDFTIEKAPLTDDELAKLKDTVLMLSRFRGLPQFGWMEEVLTEIQTKLHIDGHTESIIGFESNEFIKGLEWLELLFDYITNQQAVKIEYQPFGKSKQYFTISPYYIKQYNNRWFIFGQTAGQNTPTNLALDRITAVEPTNCKYIPNIDVNFTEYFDDVIGVTIPDTLPENILLRFTPSRLPYVLSKPLHHSQKTIDKENGIIQITVKPNRELMTLLLSFGEDVEVIQPEPLRNKIASKIQKMQQIYHLCK